MSKTEYFYKCTILCSLTFNQTYTILTFAPSKVHTALVVFNTFAHLINAFACLLIISKTAQQTNDRDLELLIHLLYI